MEEKIIKKSNIKVKITSDIPINTDQLIHTLQQVEFSLLNCLTTNTTFKKILTASKLQEIQGMRALQWLENKGLINTSKEITEQIVLDKNGILYKEKKLPEKRLLDIILKENKLKREDLIRKYNFDIQEINISLGILKSKAAINILKENNELFIEITEQGKKLAIKKSFEEIFLNQNFPVKVSDLKPELIFAFNNLKKRKKIIKIDILKKIHVSLTEKGKTIQKIVSNKNFNIKKGIGPVTDEIIKCKNWEKLEFRRIDINADVPKLYPGKIHFVNQAINYIKQIWLELGFEEMEGNHVQTAFRDLDALFVPQDHPAREMQDTFYIKDPKEGNIPKELYTKVKDMHEHGGDLNSKGWGNKFSESVAKQNLLRTHSTVLSAEYISKLKEKDLPKKYFCVGKVYRNEALDWKHLFEFHQVEGIVIDPNANFKHLIGYLTEFYKKMGFEKIRIRPAHFPYTEPSVEIEVFHPIKKEWVELGGAGIFRPEVVKPLLGIDVPVLAWGQGMERGIVDYFKLQDLRDLYRNDIKQIKKMKYWMK